MKSVTPKLLAIVGRLGRSIVVVEIDVNNEKKTTIKLINWQNEINLNKSASNLKNLDLKIYTIGDWSMYSMTPLYSILEPKFKRSASD